MKLGFGRPGIPSYSFGRGTLRFLGDNETVYFQSEETGYSHLYTYNFKVKKENPTNQRKLGSPQREFVKR